MSQNTLAKSSCTRGGQVSHSGWAGGATKSRAMPTRSRTTKQSDSPSWSEYIGKDSGDKLWLALIGVSGLSAAVLLLRRRRRLLAAETTVHAKRPSEQPGTNGARHSPRHDTEPRARRPPRPPGLAKSGSLSDTYAWNTQAVDIGGVLGVDIGGTLSKLVYFEKKAPSKTDSERRPSEDPMGMKVCYLQTSIFVFFLASTSTNTCYVPGTGKRVCLLFTCWFKKRAFVEGCVRTYENIRSEQSQ